MLCLREGDFSGRDWELCFPLSSFDSLESCFRSIPVVPLAIHEIFRGTKFDSHLTLLMVFVFFFLCMLSIYLMELKHFASFFIFLFMNLSSAGFQRRVFSADQIGMLVFVYVELEIYFSHFEFVAFSAFFLFGLSIWNFIDGLCSHKVKPYALVCFLMCLCIAFWVAH